MKITSTTLEAQKESFKFWAKITAMLCSTFVTFIALVGVFWGRVGYIKIALFFVVFFVVIIGSLMLMSD